MRPCTALLGDRIGVSVRMVDAILWLAGFVGDWMGGSVWGCCGVLWVTVYGVVSER